MVAIGQRIRQLRERHGLSQKQVAQEINSSQNYLSLLETNKRNPSLNTLEVLAGVFGCHVGDFFHNEDVESPPAVENKIELRTARQLLFKETSERASEPLSLPAAVRAFSLEDTYREAEGRGEWILAQDTLKRLDRMATLYEVQFTLKEYFDQRQPWSKIARVISEDRVLTVKVWEAGRMKAMEGGKVLEGPEEGRPPTTGHVETALRFLGETGIKVIVLQTAKREQEDLMQAVSLGCPEFDRSFWCQGVMTAHAMFTILSRVDSRRLEALPPSVIFRMGLLLDVGMLFMHLEDPKSVRSVWVECTRTPTYTAYARGEWRLYQKHLHALKGAQVMRFARWSPPEIQVTEYHHEPAAAGASHPHLFLIQCAHVADVIASLMVYAPALGPEDLDLDPVSFDAVFGRRDPQLIRSVIGEIVDAAQADMFNQSWSWPGYRTLLSLMVPSVFRGGRSGPSKKEDYHQAFWWWLEQNKNRVGTMLIRYQNRRRGRDV